MGRASHYDWLFFCYVGERPLKFTCVSKIMVLMTEVRETLIQHPCLSSVWLLTCCLALFYAMLFGDKISDKSAM